MKAKKIFCGYILEGETYGVYLDSSIYLEGLIAQSGMDKALELFQQIVWVEEGEALPPETFKDLCRRKSVAATLKIQEKLQDPYQGKVTQLILRKEKSEEAPKYWIVDMDRKEILKK